ncbi:MAG: FAD:protein FMN transferase [Deltaproteobacteria bacterium]|nr:FAD:protein FMN transferase [Deltaproteobacteria bacterium]
MGTIVRVVAYPNRDVSESATRLAVNKAMEEFRRIEQLMSPRQENSDLVRMNSHSGEHVQVSEDTFRVTEKAIWAGKLSSGAFDITFATMSDLWKFGDWADAHPKPPDPERVADRRRLIDYTKVELDPATRQVMVPKGRTIGLGGIAKGYAVDVASGVMRAAGVRDFMLQAGGDMYASGTKPGGEPWTTGVQDPRGAPDSIFARMELRDSGLSTAGDYERFYIDRGIRYHHIIDPRTGYPAKASRSVSIVAPSAFLTDAIDDAVFILGPEKGLAIVESLPDVGAVIVDEHNKVWISKRLEGKVSVQRQPTP